MTPKESERVYQTLFAQRGVELRSLTVARALQLASEFYADHRVAGANLEDDEDMLLFQWGVAEIDDHEWFYFDLTRQFIWASRLSRFIRTRILGWEPADVTTMSQLHLTLLFRPTAALAELGNGNHWCRRPAEVGRFRELIASGAPYQQLAVAGLSPDRVELRFEFV